MSHSRPYAEGIALLRIARHDAGIYGAHVTNSWFRRGTAWLRARDLILLAALSGIGVLVVGFIKIASEVGEKETRAVDEAILLAMRNAPDDPIGSDKFQAAVMHISALGSGVVTGLIVLIVVSFCVLAGHKRYALLVLACSVGTGLIMWMLKGFFERERPTVVTHIDPPGGTSFPSGHSMISAALYLTLAALIARTLEQRRLKVFVIAVGALLTMMVGVSRMYLGVHYPTDVIAGWTAGAVWALICGLTARTLGKRGAVPVPHAEGDAKPGGDASVESK